MPSVVIDYLPACAEHYRDEYAIVVIDVIRATTTATTALSFGREVYPVKTTDEAFVLASTLIDPLLIGVFDLVVTNGVLHSTSDPYGVFKALLSVLKPGGCIIVGLYNWLGRLPTLVRASIFARLGRRSYGLDRRLSKRDLNRGRWQAWFRDQYEHPHETTHSYDEVLGWFDENDVEFLSALPEISGIVDDCRDLFVPHDRMSKVDRYMTEVDMLLEGGRDGGLFIMIGRKRS